MAAPAGPSVLAVANGVEISDCDQWPRTGEVVAHASFGYAVLPSSMASRRAAAFGRNHHATVAYLMPVRERKRVLTRELVASRLSPISRPAGSTAGGRRRRSLRSPGFPPKQEPVLARFRQARHCALDDNQQYGDRRERFGPRSVVLVVHLGSDATARADACSVGRATAMRACRTWADRAAG